MTISCILHRSPYIYKVRSFEWYYFCFNCCFLNFPRPLQVSLYNPPVPGKFKSLYK
jgi:hypothetical protein